jgi:hypothetical protein
METEDEPGDDEPAGYPIRWIGRTSLIVGSLLLVLGFAASAAVEPDPRGYGTHQQFGMDPCSFYVLLGIPCPSCGSTTAFANFVRGHWIAAARANVAGFLLALVCAGLIPWSWYSVWLGRMWRVDDPARSLAWLLIILAGISLLHWGVRCLG